VNIGVTPNSVMLARIGTRTASANRRYAESSETASGKTMSAPASTQAAARSIADSIPATASASVHLAEVGTTIAAGASHWRFGNVDWKLVLRLGVPGATGAFLGATVLSALSTEDAAPYMAGALLALGVGLGAYLKEGSDFNSMPGVIAAIFLILIVGIGIELLAFRPIERRILRARGLATP